jgi:hypothetical protein
MATSQVVMVVVMTAALIDRLGSRPVMGTGLITLVTAAGLASAAPSGADPRDRLAGPGIRLEPLFHRRQHVAGAQPHR